MTQRYCEVRDNDSHHYIIPVERQAEWWKWLELPDSDTRSWDVPEYAERIDGGTLTFTDPKVE